MNEKEIITSIKTHSDYISKNVQAESIYIVSGINDGTEIDINGVKLIVKINKVEKIMKEQTHKTVEIFVIGDENIQPRIDELEANGFNLISTNYFDNEDLANLYLIFGRNARKLFKAVVDKNPIHILKNGFTFTDDRKKICKYWKRIHVKSIIK